MSWNSPGVGVASIDLAASCAGTPLRCNFANLSTWRLAFLGRQFRQKIIQIVWAPRRCLGPIECETRLYALAAPARPSFPSFSAPAEKRAQGMPGVGLAHGPPAEKNRRQSPQVQPNVPA